MKKFLLDTYDFFHRRKLLFYAVTVGVFALLVLAASRIKIEEDVARMMPNGKQTEKINSILQHSHFADKIIIKISSKGEAQPDDLITQADSLESHLQAGYAKYITEIKTKVSDQTAFDIYRTVHNNLPVYLDEKDYKAIDTLLTPEHIHNALQNDYKVLTSASGLVMKRLIADDPVGISTIALKKLQTLQLDDNYELYDNYILTKDHKNLIMFVTPVNPPGETGKNAVFVEGFNKIVTALNANSKNAIIYYYGGPVAAVCNAKQLKKDTAVTLTITIVCLLLFIGVFFRRKRVPFVMMLPVVFGGLFSVAIIALVKGNISSIALGAGSIILGIAINYSLHFFSHYKHCGSIKETIVDLLEPMTIGSFTTVGSFFSLMLLRSQILNDFGLFAGLSLTGATIFSLIFLPHFVPLQEENSVDTAHESWFDKIPAIKPKWNFALVAIILGLTIYFFPHALNVGFDSDLNSFNFLTPDLKKSEAEITMLQGDSAKTVFIASTGKTTEDVLQNNEGLLHQLDSAVQRGWVRKYSSISYFIPSQSLQAEKLKRWNAYWTADKKNALLAELRKSGAEFKFKPAAFQNFENLLNKEYVPAGEEDFAAIKIAFGSDYMINAAGMQTVVNSVNVDKSERAKLYAYLDSHSSTVVLDKQVITNKFISIIYNDFNSILMYSSLIVFFALLFTYGRIELTIMTFLPMVISWIWILGIMSLFGVKFNIINIIISTFIFGLGDDFSIFVTDGLTGKFKEGKETLASHKVSIFLAAGTTIIGLGALIFARHPALRSIAVISILGVACVLLIGQTIQPFLYNFFVQKRKEKGFAPWTFPSLALSIFAFTYFVFSALWLTIVGFILLYAVPFVSKRKRKLAYHWLLSKAVGSLVYLMMNVRKVHINRGQMDFSKPAIIIANHQSFLDILITVMQHPKLILLTNKWVFYSPFFGKVVQLADYYPVMEGVDPAVDKFEAIVKEGYSIVIFPEGTRTPDGVLKRFHKGAFYLAEKLNIDIVPLLLHGTGDTMGKGDFMLFNGRMTLKFLPRITPDNKSYGNDYAERTKGISRYFKQEYEKLRAEIEQPEYFKQRMLMNYIYKGPYLEFFTRIKLKRDGYYKTINSLLPKQGTTTVLGCDYGFMNYMLHFLGPQRQIWGIDKNEEKINVANNCYSKKTNLHFETADVLSYTFAPGDAFIVNDILHNFDEAQQVALFTNLKRNLNTGGSILIKVGKADGRIEKVKAIVSKLGISFEMADDANSSILMIK